MPVRVALSSLVAIAVGMGGAQTQASVTQAHEPGAALPAVCSTGLSVLERAQTNTSMLLADGLITINGWVLRPTQMAWRARSPDNPVLAAVFHSDSWLIPVALTDDTGLTAAITMMVEQSQMAPDPGSDEAFEELDATGWKEDNVTKRMITASCLYTMADASGRLALTPVIEQLANANMDPHRYYGPPLHHVHNHGVFADLELRRAGLLLDRNDWVDVATQRLTAQLNGTFDPCGMTFEQSSAYQDLHASVWSRIANDLPPDVGAIALRMAARADRALQLLARPDGIVEAIGDGPQLDISSVLHTYDDSGQPFLRTGTLWCPNSGWYATTNDDSGITQHLTARFGPQTGFHGHSDHGGLTWWTGTGWNGVPVLSDRGLFGKQRDSRFSYAHSSAAHSTLRWDAGTARAMKGTRTPTGLQMSAHGGGSGWERSVSLGRGQRTLVVSDLVRGVRPTPMVQRFTLDPVWRKTERAGVFTTSDGWTLTMTCSLGLRSVRPVATRVEHYPKPGHVQGALSVDCGSTSRLAGLQFLTARLTVTN